MNTKFYYFHYGVFGHNDEKCYAWHGYVTGHKMNKGSQGTILLLTMSLPGLKPLPIVLLRKVLGLLRIVELGTSNLWNVFPKRRGSVEKKKNDINEGEEKKMDDMKEDKAKEENPIGLFGFPLYSDKVQSEALA